MLPLLFKDHQLEFESHSKGHKTCFTGKLKDELSELFNRQLMMKYKRTSVKLQPSSAAVRSAGWRIDVDSDMKAGSALM